MHFCHLIEISCNTVFPLSELIGEVITKYCFSEVDSGDFPYKNKFGIFHHQCHFYVFIFTIGSKSLV